MSQRKKAPTLTAIIPTPGKGRPLARCLDSLVPQMTMGDEVLIIGDTHDGPLPETEALVKRYAQDTGHRFIYVAHDAGYHGWGHPQINVGIELATGEYLCFNDDDDAFTPDAFQSIRCAILELKEPRPLLFRFVSHWGMPYWDRQEVVQDHIGGHCAVFPNIPERLGRWTDRYQGDFDFIRSTLDLWPNKDADVVWCEDVIAVARPKEPLK